MTIYRAFSGKGTLLEPARLTRMNEVLDGTSTGIASLVGMAYLSTGATPGNGRFGDAINRRIDYVLKGVDKAVSGVPGATAKSDKEASTVTLSAPDQVTVQKVAGAKGNTAAKGAELFEVTGDFTKRRQYSRR